MRRQGVKTFGRDGINYDKSASDPQIKSFWISGHRPKKAADEVVQPTGDIRRICGPAAGHVPVICNPSVEAAYPLNGDPNGVYADCTFGRGGHSAALLARLGERGSLYAFDVDPSAVAVGRQVEQKDPRFHMVHRPFSSLADAIPEDLELSGVLMDLGFSSPQMDKRFHEGPLDLRYNPLQGLPASTWMTFLTAPELAWLFRQHGEDEDVMLCARLGESIHQHQMVHGAFESSAQLEALIELVKRGLDDRRQLPSKLTIQSIRTWMNQEFFEFEKVLEGSFKRLKYGGRCAVICFKRQETLTLTKFITAHEEPDPDLVEGWPRARVIECYPLLKSDKKFCVRVVCNPIGPTDEELLYNNRARSARTHVLEKRRRRVRWGLPAGTSGPLFVKPSAQRMPVVGGCEPAPTVFDPPPDMPPDDMYCNYISAPSTPLADCSPKAVVPKSTPVTPVTPVPTAVSHSPLEDSVAATAAVGYGSSGSSSYGLLAGLSNSAPAASPLAETFASNASCVRAETAGNLVSPGGNGTSETDASSIEEWLRRLDNGVGALLIYRDVLQSEFKSFTKLECHYSTAGEGFDVSQFCREHGVRRAAHRRFIDLWAKSLLA